GGRRRPTGRSGPSGDCGGRARWSAWRRSARRRCASSTGGPTRASEVCADPTCGPLYGREREELARRCGTLKDMPDQSSAATEHAIMQEITAPLATLPDDAVEAAAAETDFP